MSRNSTDSLQTQDPVPVSESTTLLNHDHDNSRRGDLEQHDDSHPVSFGTVIKQGNMARSALPVQLLALAFMALVWRMVLLKMPLSSLPLFGYHPLLQSLSLVLLVQSILVLQPTTQHDPARKLRAMQAHQVLNLGLALPLFTAGATIMWYLHDQPGSAHFISWHGILGTVAVSWAWVQAAIGAASVWFDGALLGGGARAKRIWKWHRLSGYLLLPLFFLVAALGVAETTWARNNSDAVVRVAIVAALALAIVLVVIRLKPSKLPKLV
ncbi:uncharacterized protein PFL1_06515 [Pseudozyma flocculosa PF-1]|uniref:Related to Cytochrome b561 n=2 Tax=Pseudozyma flocculosa TaxID=84751 RepID=A0A5C3F8G2_9BASI|nr:uncharacterized protein PFL1_06515 [Pseudozyma flocculosa PF-1]EPQ25840.1 hypothetical protein PFL1_06515 [Pseudozyma flocculosa PF-1]SPO40662.1 related to Cytochrome b561 [Pseudozyma flocculosa]